MKIYKTKVFAKWQSKEKLSDFALCNAAEEVVTGLIDADLGSGIFKKRIAKAGAGKSGGYRTILATKIDGVIFFIFGFGKNEKANISSTEKQTFTEIGSKLLGFSLEEINKLISEQKLFEVHYEKK